MTTIRRRRKSGYFPLEPGSPAPLVVRVPRRIRFSDVDPMGILWYGRFACLFEDANDELGRRCGMSYADFKRERVGAPIVQFHVDYFASPVLGEETVTTGRLCWSQGARMNMEYEIHKEDGQLAATGYTVQMFVDERGEPFLVPPPLQEACRKRWLAGELSDLR